VGALALALPNAAVGATPGHYTGTTEQNYPVSFDVAADGASLTNVVTTANGFCVNGGGVPPISANSTYAFPIAGDAFDGYDAGNRPYLKFRGSFTATRARGTLDVFGANTGGSCNALQVPWTAALAGGGGGDQGGGGGDTGGGGGDQGGGDTGTGGGAGQPVLAVSFPKGVKLKPSLTNGFFVGFSVDRAIALSAKLILSAKDAKKYGLGKKALTVSKATAAGGVPDSAFGFKFKKAVAKKLKKAKSLKFLLEVTGAGYPGVLASQTLKLS
jgi:hypothetical protein